jgi:DNA repair protein RadA
MGRTKGSKNKEDSGEPQELETTLDALKEEKSTEDKKIKDFEADVTKEGTGEGDIKRLEDLRGIGPKTAEKLRELGYSVVGLATGRAEEVKEEMKVTFAVAKGWVMQAQEAVMAKMIMKNANDYDKEKKATQQFILTGSSEFNTMLGGGIPTESITGLGGRFASGKTQICNDAVVYCIGVLKEKAVYIEPEPDTFNLDRLKEIAVSRGIECNWDNLYVCPAKQIPTPKAQFLQYKMVQKLLEKGENIRLVVVDSFNAKFRGGWSKSEMLPIRTREFGEHFNIMEYLAATYNIAWLLTFQVIAPPRPEQGLKMRVKFEDEYYPVGGDYVLHSVNNWVALQQVAGELWEANLFDSSHVKRGNSFFIISTKGIVDGGWLADKKKQAKENKKQKDNSTSTPTEESNDKVTI